MSYRIPLFDLNFDEAEEQAVIDCLRSKWISAGPRINAFEARFAEMSGCGVHAVALANCTVALHLALLLAGVTQGDEVICPSLTFVATANAVRFVGAVPVFADVVGDHDLTIDPEDIEAKITPRTRAILVMHYGGFPCDMDRIMALAGTYGLKVIEDACHAPFSEYRDGRKLGTIGQSGCFSFFSNKNLSTGEGGMLITRDADLAARAKLLRSHGMTSMSYQRAQGHSTTYDVVEYGYNYRMDDLRASLGLAQLDKIPADYARRAALRERYEDELAGKTEVIVPFAGRTGNFSNYVLPILLAEGGAARRDMVRNSLAQIGIQTSVHYPPVHRFSTYRPFTTALPHTESAADRLITLPMYGSLLPQQVNEVCNALLASIHG
jgi:dTDP-4-amino-4,6-dideoxygalactose transaminase